MKATPLWITNLPAADAAAFMADTTWADTCKGQPKESHKYTSDQLSRMGMVGIYRTSDRQKPLKPPPIYETDPCTTE